MSEASAVTPTEPKRGFLDLLFGLYTSPADAYRAILKNARFWVPLIGLLITNVAFTAVWSQKVDAKAFMEARIDESPRADRIPPAQKTRIVEMQARFLPAMAWGGAVLVPTLLVLILGSLFFFVFRFFYGSDIRWGQALTVYAWAALAVSVVVVPLMLTTLILKEDWTLAPQSVLQANLSLLLDKQSTAKPLYSLAESLDLFSFWTLFLLSTGYGVASRRSTGSAAVGVVSLWLIYVLGKAGLSALF